MKEELKREGYEVEKRGGYGEPDLIARKDEKVYAVSVKSYDDAKASVVTGGGAKWRLCYGGLQKYCWGKTERRIYAPTEIPERLTFSKK